MNKQLIIYKWTKSKKTAIGEIDAREGMGKRGKSQERIEKEGKAKKINIQGGNQYLLTWMG